MLRKTTANPRFSHVNELCTLHVYDYFVEVNGNTIPLSQVASFRVLRGGMVYTAFLMACIGAGIILGGAFLWRSSAWGAALLLLMGGLMLLVAKKFMRYGVLRLRTTDGEDHNLNIEYGEREEVLRALQDAMRDL